MASGGEGSRPSHLMIIPNTKRHPNNTKTVQLPIFKVTTGLPRPYHNTSASPRSLTKKLAMSFSSTVHGGQHDTKYVKFELLLHAAFVADEVGVLCLNQLVSHEEYYL